MGHPGRSRIADEIQIQLRAWCILDVRVDLYGLERVYFYCTKLNWKSKCLLSLRSGRRKTIQQF